MASTAIPIASARPSFGPPPTTALPPLPTSKARRRSQNISSGDSTVVAHANVTSIATAPMTTALPRPSPVDEAPSGLRRPSGLSPTTRTISEPATTSSTVASSPTLASAMPTSRPATSRAVTQGPGSGPGPGPVGKDVRRAVSLAAFPQPPNGATRKSSLPVSPLSAGTIYLPPTSTMPTDARDLSKGVSRLKRASGRVGSNSNLAAAAKTSNGVPARRSVSTGPGARVSDPRSSLNSQCSSADGSDSTTATTFEDSGDSAARPPEGDDADTQAAAKRGSRQKDGKGNVIVSVRVRPDGNGESGRVDGEWMVDGRRSLIGYRGREGGDYHYDYVFAPHDRNAKVYDACAKRLVRRVMEGYHGTVFAYGMTGTGKTFSMQGTASSPGVIPLAITDIFSYIRETPNREFLLRVSYLEIYNERIYDLLSVPVASGVGNGGPGLAQQQQQEEIKLREDSKRGVYATPLKEEIVQSPTQLLRVIARGDLARRTSSTQYNARSSRSHAVVQIVVESRERQLAQTARDNRRAAMLPGGVRVSTLSLIDLAGSERAAESKERRQEGAHINKSLLTLGTVIARLSGSRDKDGKATDKEGQHLPYRDSKLTRLLQPALSGNSLISILCTIQVGPSGSSAAPGAHTHETLNTLKFAARAKNNIVSHAKRAEEAFGNGAGDAASRALLERYRMEIQELRQQLENQAREKRDEEEKSREKEVAQRHEEQMLEMQLARTALKERIEHLNRLILCSKSTGVNASGGGSHLLALGAYGAVPRPGDGPISPVSTGFSRGSLGAGSESLVRTASTGSVSGAAGGATLLTPGSSGLASEPGADEDDSMGEYGDGTASLAAQVRALQADLVDKNRYIATLEKRLLQARRSSHSRISRAFSPTHRLNGSGGSHGGGSSGGGGGGEESDVNALLLEKDNEIADLRARLDDKDHMMTALRSAARKRDVADRPATATALDRHNPLIVHGGGSTAAAAALAMAMASPTTPTPTPTPTLPDDPEQLRRTAVLRTVTT